MLQKFLQSSVSPLLSAIILRTFLSFLLANLLCINSNYKSITTAAASCPPSNEAVPAVLVFGDSIVDPGNNNNLKTLIKCDFPPYGKDFMGGRPTGRFSNGKVPSDLLAQAFGVKEVLPAYLDPNLQVQDLLTGVSFASGGTGYDPLTPKIVSVLSMSDQLDMFKEYLERVREAAGEERVTAVLSKGLFLICAGSDDLANTYYSTQLRSREYDISSYTNLMVASASNFLQELYKLGARKMGVLSAPPIGCVPSQRTAAGGLERRCVEARNQAALLFNSKLSSRMNVLNRQLPGSKLVFADVYSPLLALIQNPAQNGFEEASKGCCGTGTIEVTLLCNRYSPGTCSDVSKYIFWDSYHPTQNAYSILVNEVFNKYCADFF